MARRKGIPSIRQRKDRNGKKLDCWEALITLGRDPGTGKVKRLAVYGKTQQECRDKLIETLQSIKNQTFVEPHKITLGEWLDTWLNDYKKNNLRPSTYASYEYLIRYHIKPKLGKAFLKDLRPETIQRFYNELLKTMPERAKVKLKKLEAKYNNAKDEEKKILKAEIEELERQHLSTSSIKHIHNILHGSLDQAIKNGLIVRNVTDAVILPRHEKQEMRVLNKEEQNRFMKILSFDKMGIIFKLDLATGMRKGELLALTWGNVNLKEGEILVSRSLSRTRVNFEESNNENKTAIIIQKPKTKKGERRIPLFDSIISDLKKHKEAEKEKLKNLGWNDIKIKQHFKDGLVFTNELGGPIEPRNLTRKFYKLVKAAGIPKANLHCLRHTFATRLLEMGVSPKVIQEILGHSTITLTLDTYSHVMPELKKDAVDKLSGLFENKPVNAEQKANSAT